MGQSCDEHVIGGRTALGVVLDLYDFVLVLSLELEQEIAVDVGELESATR